MAAPLRFSGACSAGAWHFSCAAMRLISAGCPRSFVLFRRTFLQLCTHFRFTDCACRLRDALAKEVHRVKPNDSGVMEMDKKMKQFRHVPRSTIPAASQESHSECSAATCCSRRPVRCDCDAAFEAAEETSYKIGDSWQDRQHAC